MIRNTFWWGIVLISENEEEHQLLKKLYDLQTEYPDGTYEYGTVDWDEERTLTCLQRLEGMHSIAFNR